MREYGKCGSIPEGRVDFLTESLRQRILDEDDRALNLEMTLEQRHLFKRSPTRHGATISIWGKRRVKGGQAKIDNRVDAKFTQLGR